MGWLPSWLQPVPPPNVSREGSAPRSESAVKVEIVQRPPALLEPSGSSSESPELFFLRQAQETLASGLQDAKLDHESGPMMTIPITAFAIGFGTGLYQAAKRSSLVFMAENAHRRPDTVQGWYFYNKTKNYKVLLAGIKGGFKTGTRVGLWTLAYVGIEYGVVDLQREYERQYGKDSALLWTRSIAGGVAGLSIASGASLLYRLPGPVSRRTLLLGLLGGATIGALRDAQRILTERKFADFHHTS